ncbi:unnamed protein product [Ostreobium quekettii]|uniref:EamA domain-containing protein n=1 Tax=Ostreobium quekettii TaxID=121088 RepID=A0A8S1IMX3_9CHLO|nr:unnamed protein product [Ostreobium quekettii]|eukprot:evm.model.scf_11.25 EVM.evm.TU.scf_11.25   scf_11:225258-228381(-)
MTFGGAARRVDAPFGGIAELPPRRRVVSCRAFPWRERTGLRPRFGDAALRSATGPRLAKPATEDVEDAAEAPLDVREAPIGVQSDQPNGTEPDVSHGSPEDGSGPKGESERLGMGMLVLVAVLWGTYSPALKFIYNSPGAPTPAVLSAIKAAMSSAFLFAGTLIGRAGGGGSGDEPLRKKNLSGARMRVEGEQEEEEQGDAKLGGNGAHGRLGGRTGALWAAGAELGFWNFLATACQAVGIQYTEAIRAAFLIQATAVFTPLVARFAGDLVNTNVWIGCMAGLLGSVLITMDTGGACGEDCTALSSSAGDWAILVAALLYSISTVRLGARASQFDAIYLATSKTLALAVLSAGWVVADAAGLLGQGQPVHGLWQDVGNPVSWLVLVWAALGPGAIAALLQTKGQQLVTSSQSQVFFASTPLWSALISGALLGETMGVWGWVGGAVIVAGGILSSLTLEDVGQS